MAEESEARGLWKHHVARKVSRCQGLLRRTEGIVLKSTLFGEADLIVTYLTRDYGVMSAFAKSPRKIKSRFGSSLEPLTYSKISLVGKEDTNLPRLTQSDIIEPFHSLREDFNCLARVSEMLEVTLRFLPEREPNEEIFRLLLTTLSALEGNCGNRVYTLYYKLRFLHISGFSPKLDVCGRCGRCTSRDGHHEFYVTHGALLCHDCVEGTDEPMPLSESAVRFCESLARWHPLSIHRIKAPDALITEITSLIDSHIRYILARPLKSSAVFSGNGRKILT